MTSETISHWIGDRVLTLTFERSGPGRAGSPFELVRERLTFVDRLRGDIEAYRLTPPTDEERAAARQHVRFDLGDEDVDYDLLYGSWE